MANLLSASSTAKKAAGEAAAELVQSGMLVGLGTGTTAVFFIDRLIERCRSGLKITAVATSQRSMQRAREGGIPILDINAVTKIDMVVDGADEIDQEKRMIKGGGGALLREKIIASMSSEMVVIVDSSKVVDYLGHFHLPVEIVPFAYHWIIKEMEQLGYRGTLRKNKEAPYVTDNGNYIFDIQLNYPCLNPEADEKKLKAITGVVETGFFFKLAGRVIVGYENGTTKFR